MEIETKTELQKTFDLASKGAAGFGFVRILDPSQRHTQTITQFWIRNWKASIMMFCAYGTATGQFIYFSKNISITEDVYWLCTEMGLCTCTCILALAKTYTIVLNRKFLWELLVELEDLWPKEDAEETQQLIVKDKFAELLNGSKVYYWITWVYMWSGNSLPLVRMAFRYVLGHPVPLLLPYAIWTPFDITTHPQYEMAYLFHIGAGVSVLYGVLFVDLIQCSLTSNLATLLVLLQHRIGKLRPGTEGEYDKLMDLIKLHQTYIRISNDLEKIFAPSLLFNLSLSSSMLCFSIFYATLLEDLFEPRFKTSVMFTFSQVAMVCWYGEQLVSSSLGIATAAYDSEWLDGDATFRRSFQMVILRSQRPLQLTALSFSVVSLQMFGNILASAFSYLALLKNFFGD